MGACAMTLGQFETDEDEHEAGDEEVDVFPDGTAEQSSRAR